MKEVSNEEKAAAVAVNTHKKRWMRSANHLAQWINTPNRTNCGYVCVPVYTMLAIYSSDKYEHGIELRQRTTARAGERVWMIFPKHYNDVRLNESHFFPIFLFAPDSQQPLVWCCIAIAAALSRGDGDCYSISILFLYGFYSLVLSTIILVAAAAAVLLHFNCDGPYVCLCFGLFHFHFDSNINSINKWTFLFARVSSLLM